MVITFAADDDGDDDEEEEEEEGEQGEVDNDDNEKLDILITLLNLSFPGPGSINAKTNCFSDCMYMYINSC